MPGALDFFALAATIRRHFCSSRNYQTDDGFGGDPETERILPPYCGAAIASTRFRRKISRSGERSGELFFVALDERGEVTSGQYSVGETKMLVLMRQIFHGLECKQEKVDMSGEYGARYSGREYLAMVCENHADAHRIDGESVKRFLDSMFPVDQDDNYLIFNIGHDRIAKANIRRGTERIETRE